jgi:hypothetical protein
VAQAMQAVRGDLAFHLDDALLLQRLDVFG